MAVLALPLAQLDRASLPYAGGKAANLGELLTAGFPVPDGFCLTTEAYWLALKQGGLLPQLERLLDGLDIDTPASLAETGAAVRSLILSVDVPADVRHAVQSMLPAYGAGPFAVRSSATAEDLPEASFAGQQETYLNVVGEEVLLAAVRRCWASLWTDRAIAYRQRNGIEHESVALAVVVQKLVAAEAAGVLFTANPVTGKRGEIAIDAGLGLGEAVVSGAVAPDSYLVAKSEWRVTQRILGGKALAIVPLPGGGTERRETAPLARERQALSDEWILALARLGQRVEEHFGWPQDVEWALADGRLYLLQSRPITSLFPVPPAPKDGKLHVYISLNSLQGMLEPFTPLGASFFLNAAREAALGGREDRQFLHVLAGRIFADVTPLLRTQLGRSLIPRYVLPQVDNVAARILEQVLADQRLAPAPRSPRGDLRRFFTRFWRRLLPAVTLLVRYLLFPGWAESRVARVIVPRVDAFQAEAEGGLAFGQRLELLELFWRQRMAGFFLDLVPLVGAGAGSYFRAEGLVHDWGLSTDLLPTARQGLPNNPTTQMDLNLWALAVKVRADQESRQALSREEPATLADLYHGGLLPGPLQRGFAGFLAKYGHRGVREIDLGMPRWGEDPSYLLGVLQGYLGLTDPEQFPDRHFARQTKAAEQAVAELLAEARRLPRGRVKAALVGFFLGRFRRLGGHRETPKFQIMRLFAVMRRLLLGAGEDLARAGWLERAEDVVYLHFDELRDVEAGRLDAACLVAERRGEHERELRRLRAPRVITSEGEAFYGASLPGAAGELAGSPVSPGVARGPARVIRDPRGARLLPGEILVAPSTDPAWTPLFLVAGGLVMEAGGMMSHGAIVAREYGIPAVAGVVEATTRLATGQIIEVDGTRGAVRPLAEQQPGG